MDGRHVNSMFAHPYCIKKGRQIYGKEFVTGSRTEQKNTGKAYRSRWQLYLLLLLPLAWLIIFAYVPMGGLVIAFKKYNVRQGIWGSEWLD